MTDVLKIVLTLAAIAGLIWAYLEICVYLDLWTERVFGRSLRLRRQNKMEIQTLFHGNTKDQDQL